MPPEKDLNSVYQDLNRTRKVARMLARATVDGIDCDDLLYGPDYMLVRLAQDAGVTSPSDVTVAELRGTIVRAAETPQERVARKVRGEA